MTSPRPSALQRGTWSPASAAAVRRPARRRLVAAAGVAAALLAALPAQPAAADARYGGWTSPSSADPFVRTVDAETGETTLTGVAKDPDGGGVIGISFDVEAPDVDPGDPCAPVPDERGRQRAFEPPVDEVAFEWRVRLPCNREYRVTATVQTQPTDLTDGQNGARLVQDFGAAIPAPAPSRLRARFVAADAAPDGSDDGADRGGDDEGDGDGGSGPTTSLPGDATPDDGATDPTDPDDDGEAGRGGDTGTAAVELTWAADEEEQAPDHQGWEVWRAVAGGGFAPVATVEEPAYRDADLRGGGRYDYRVFALRPRPDPGTAEPVRSQPATVGIDVPGAPAQPSPPTDPSSGAATDRGGSASTTRRPSTSGGGTATTVDRGFSGNLDFGEVDPADIPEPGDPDDPGEPATFGDGAVVAELDGGGEPDPEGVAVPLAGGLALGVFAMQLRYLTRQAGRAAR